MPTNLMPSKTLATKSNDLWVPNQPLGNGVLPIAGLGALKPARYKASDPKIQEFFDYEIEYRQPYTYDAKRKKHVEVVRGENAAMALDKPYYLVRDDNNFHIGQVSDRFGFMQPKEFLSLVSELNMDIINVGEFDFGSTIFIEMIADEFLLSGGDKIHAFVLATDTFTGKRSVYIACVDNRTSCWNSMIANFKAAERLFRMEHVGDPERRLQMMKLAIDHIRNYYAEFVNVSEELIATKFSKKNFEKLVTETLIPMVGATKRGTTKTENQWQRIFDCYNVENLANYEGTAWKAIQALADFDQHYRIVQGLDNDATRRLALERNVKATINGTTFMNQAFEEIMVRSGLEHLLPEVDAEEQEAVPA